MSFILLGILNAQAAGAPAPETDFDLLETTTLASSASSVTFSSLNSTYGSSYKHLQIRAVARSARSGSNIDNFSLKANADTGSNHSNHRLYGAAGSVFSDSSLNNNSIDLGDLTAATSATNAFAASVVDILDFADTSKNTTFRTLTGALDRSRVYLSSGLFDSTVALDSVEFFANNANLVTGSRFSLYGVKG